MKSQSTNKTQWTHRSVTGKLESLMRTFINSIVLSPDHRFYIKQEAKRFIHEHFTMAQWRSMCEMSQQEREAAIQMILDYAMRNTRSQMTVYMSEKAIPDLEHALSVDYDALLQGVIDQYKHDGATEDSALWARDIYMAMAARIYYLLSKYVEESPYAKDMLTDVDRDMINHKLREMIAWNITSAISRIGDGRIEGIETLEPVFEPLIGLVESLLDLEETLIDIDAFADTIPVLGDNGEEGDHVTP